jgi:hypothetical protein
MPYHAIVIINNNINIQAVKGNVNLCEGLFEGFSVVIFLAAADCSSGGRN